MSQHKLHKQNKLRRGGASLIKPILYMKTAFDARYETAFEYIYQGNQQFASCLVIRAADSNETVYQETQTTFRLEHKLPGETLTNGKSWTAEVIVYDANNTPSQASDKIYFKTLTTPGFYIENLADNQIVHTSTYELSIAYEQPEGELLDEFQITVYDLSHNIVSRSGRLYPANGMTYTLYSLLDNQGYYLKLTGMTVNRMALDLPETAFSVRYVSPASYSRIYLENVPMHASVRIQSNLLLLDVKPNHEPVAYIDGEKVDLSEDGKWVEYVDGFNIESDFVIQITAENIPLNKTFFEMTDKSGRNAVTLQKWYGNFAGYDGAKEYFVLHATNGALTYRAVSNFIEPAAPAEQITTVVKRIGSLYSVEAHTGNNETENPSIDGGDGT